MAKSQPLLHLYLIFTMSELYEYVYVWMHPLVCARGRPGLGLGRLCSLRQDLSLNLERFVWTTLAAKEAPEVCLVPAPRFPVTDIPFTPGFLHSAGVWTQSLMFTQCWS